MLFIDPREGLQTVPSKLFEYLMLQRPILAIIPEQSEVADIIRQTQSGVVVDSRAPEKAVNEIKQQLDLWKTNTSSPWSPDLSEIDKFNRRNLTGRLAEVLNQIKGLQRM
jgi:predicted metal-dependent RNase